VRPLAALALLTLLAACDRAAPPSDRERVLHAVDALREAPAGDARRRLLDDLARLPAAEPAAVRARDTCAAAYRLLFDGDAIAVNLRVALERGEPPGPDAAKDLREAEEKIAKAKEAMPACEEAQEALRRPR
jgi:hypothetical protein